jgi:hypothetical protein
MGRRDRRELESRLTVLLSHLLKWQMQSDEHGATWSSTIGEQRKRISRKLRGMPSLRRDLDGLVTEIYADARRNAAAETRIPEDNFPPECPFSPADILSDRFLPR